MRSPSNENTQELPSQPRLLIPSQSLPLLPSENDTAADPTFPTVAPTANSTDGDYYTDDYADDQIVPVRGLQTEGAEIDEDQVADDQDGGEGGQILEEAGVTKRGYFAIVTIGVSICHLF